MADNFPAVGQARRVLDWLDERIQAGRGEITFCLTEPRGDVGLFTPDGEGGDALLGSGQSAEEAVLDAMQRAEMRQRLPEGTHLDPC